VDGKEFFRNNMHFQSGLRYYNWVIIITFLFFLGGCGVYSFTGASIPPEAKTISVQFIENNAELVEPSLSQSFTEALRDKFTTQTNLYLVDLDGDLQIEGEIRAYDVKPVAIQGDETAALNRLSITVFIKFVNTFDENANFESSFTRFEDYPSDQDISSVKDALIFAINEQLVDDIFNKAVVNW
jgi:hypothetical protein